MKVQAVWIYCVLLFFLNLTKPFLRILNWLHQQITNEKRGERFNSISMFLTLSQRKVWSNALMCLESSAEPSSSAKTAADQFDWSHMAFIRAVITSFYGVFYSEDRTVISLTHIPTAWLGLVLLWFGVCRHGSNNTADTQTCCSLSETVTGLQSPGKLQNGVEAAQTLMLLVERSCRIAWSYQTVWQLPRLCV